jgi:hypothetical protein
MPMSALSPCLDLPFCFYLPGSRFLKIFGFFKVSFELKAKLTLISFFSFNTVLWISIPYGFQLAVLDPDPYWE